MIVKYSNSFFFQLSFQKSNCFIMQKIMQASELQGLQMSVSKQSAEILKRKNQAIKNYKEKYEKAAKLAEQTSQRSEQLRKEISLECNQINETLAKLKQKSKEFIINCREALHDEQNSEIISILELANYLKSEKQFMRNITESNEEQKSNSTDLHGLVGRVELQRALRKIKKLQLQQEIKFLQGNVLVKGNFIYNPVNSLLISPAEEKQNTAKLVNLIEELERVIKLSIPCATQTNVSNKLLLLKAQQTRLHDCQSLLTQEHQKLAKFKQFIQERREAASKFQFENPYVEANNEAINEAPRHFELTIEESELDLLLDEPEAKSLTISMEHPFTYIDADITELRSKLKKIEKFS